MKNLVLALALGLALVATKAHAYNSAASYDPSISGQSDVETKAVVKSSSATYSDAVSTGHALYYSESELTGLTTVSRYYSGAGNDQTSADLIAGIATRAVATGDTAGFRIVTRGYVDYALYDATSPIAFGNSLCVGNASTNKGRLINCASSVRSPIKALEAKGSGTGTMKVQVLSR